MDQPTRSPRSEVPEPLGTRGPRRSEAGLSLLEVTIATALLALGTSAAVSSMLTGISVDEELRERGVALRAALTQVENIAGFDHEGDLQNLIDHFSDPQRASFEVEGLDLPAPGTFGTGSVTTALPVSHGRVVLDATDPIAIQVEVTVAWTSRSGQPRSLALPMTLTELLVP